MPCHVLYKREIENYIPEKIFQKIRPTATANQIKEIEKWKSWTDGEKDFTKLKKYFGRGSRSLFLQTALKTMGDEKDMNPTDLEKRVGEELNEMLLCLENFL